MVQFESTRCENCQCARGFFSAADSQVEVQLPETYEALPVGSQVTLHLSEQWLSHAALLLFGLPLLLAFTGAGLAWIAGAVTGVQALCGVAGALAGWWSIRSIGGEMQSKVYESLVLDEVDY